MRRTFNLIFLFAIILIGSNGITSAEPVIHNTQLLTTAPGRYEKCELSADITGQWNNPFDPDQIDIQGEIKTPSGKTLRIPAFWYQPYEEQQVQSKSSENVDLIKLYTNETEWSPGEKGEFLISDVAYLGRDGKTYPVDQSRWYGSGGSIVEQADYQDHPAVRYALTTTHVEHWPGACFTPESRDLTSYRGLSFSIYLKAGHSGNTLKIYFHDTVYGNSQEKSIVIGSNELRPGQWNKITWEWQDIPRPTHLNLTGKPEWRLRFAPQETGRYTVQWVVKENDKTVTSDPADIDVHASNNPGFIRISKVDPHYFVYDNGETFLPIGHDVTWSLSAMRAYFPKMHAAGENATYVALTPWDMAIEYEKLGRYNQDRSAMIDLMMQAAEQNGIYIKMSFDIHDALRPSALWSTNPYNAANGGPCEGPNDFYTNDKAWNYYSKRVRYIAARWGYSSNLMAWEAFTENDGATQCNGNEGWGYMKGPCGQQNTAMLAGFFNKLHDYLNTVDPYQRLFTASFGSDNCDDNIWRLPTIDYTQFHSYNSYDEAPHLAWWTRALTLRYKKPAMVTEFGWLVTGLPEANADPEGICIHNGIWATLLSGASGSALSWYWDTIDTRNYYPLYRSLRSFASGIDWAREGFKPVSVENVVSRRATMIVNANITGKGGFGDIPVSTFTINDKGAIKGGALPPAFLLARGRTENRSVPQFIVNYPTTGTFTVDIGTVCITPHLEIRIDGKLAKSVTLPSENVPGKVSSFDETYKMWKCDYNQEFLVNVPEGRHVITVENTDNGSSWIQTRRYRIRYTGQADIRTYGLVGAKTTVIWFQNGQSTWGNWDLPEPKPVYDIRSVIRGMKPGMRRIEWWNTWTGKVIQVDKAKPWHGSLTLNVPEFTRDIACRIIMEK